AQCERRLDCPRSSLCRDRIANGAQHAARAQEAAKAIRSHFHLRRGRARRRGHRGGDMTLETAFTNGRTAATGPVKALSVDVRDDGVAILTYDVPGESVNTLKSSFADDFEELISQIEGDSRVRAAVLISGKPESFIVGADVEMIKAAKTPKEGEELS